MTAFLKAEWKNLVFANYVVDPAVLAPYLPAGTELDLFEGRCYVSLVGFMFLETAIRGFRVPLHTNFEEFNLRFYVRFPDGNGWKRGVVFVREIVPRRMITAVARLIYNEKYYYHPMRNHLHLFADTMDVKYEFLYRHKWNSLSVTASREASLTEPGSETAFITEHYWGYTRLAPLTTSEYQVEHPLWRIHEVRDYKIDVDTMGLYGAGLHQFLAGPPASVFMAEGSGVQVNKRKLHHFHQPSPGSGNSSDLSSSLV